MIGTIERIKNSVLLKCSTLNEDVILKQLEDLIDTRIYQFAEEMVSLVGEIDDEITEEFLRNEASNLIKNDIIKKIKRKLFIDSLALQITNDSFIEDYFSKNISQGDIKDKYTNEFNKNKTSNQLNMTEDLDISLIISKITSFVNKRIIPRINENKVMVNAVSNLVNFLNEKLDDDLIKLMDVASDKYLNILLDEIKEEKDEKGDENMIEPIEEIVTKPDETNNDNLFGKYDDMTLFNKIILSLNTEEENLTRKENNLQENKKEVEKRLSDTNKNIESNIERENNLSQRKLELNSKEVELNSKLSETEVIFLNMKPLIKGLSKIKDSSNAGGSENE